MFAELDTPSVLLDLDRVERNVRRMAALRDRLGVRLRPHIKTHKIPELARLQVAEGAAGITVAKVGEAEVMAAAGIADILIAYPVVGRHKLRRLMAVAQQARVSVALDSPAAAGDLSDLGEALKQGIPIYLELDTGFHRVGVSPRDALDAARALQRLPGLELVGLASYGGHVHGVGDTAAVDSIIAAEVQLLLETRDALHRAGTPVEEISIGGTVTTSRAAVRPELLAGVTEIRPGTYIFNDLNTVAEGACREEDCAATLLATVVSRPAPDRAVIDAGSKSLSSDSSPRIAGRGRVAGSGQVVEWITEEHGMLRLDPADPLAVGDRVAVIPIHICAMMNLHDRAYGVRGGQVVETFAVAGRGRVQ